MVVAAAEKSMHLLAAAMLGWLCFAVGTAGGDQTSLQRFMATKDLLASAMLDSMKATKRKSDLAIGTGIYR